MTRERQIPRIEIATGAATLLALVALVAWSWWQRYLLLASSPFPLGVDGYYYPIQLRALLEDGSLAYPASPLTFWLMAPFAALAGPITGAKLGAALGGALAVIPAYAVGARLGKHRGAGLVAAAIAATSATSTYLTTEFVKQGVGLSVALAAVWLLLRALERPSRVRVVLALAGLLAAALAHKLAAGLVLAVGIPAVVEEARMRGIVRGRRLLYLLGAAFALGVAGLIAGLVAPERFVAPSDLELLAGLVTSDARWDAPALVRPNLTLVFDHEPLLAGVLSILAAVALVLRLGGTRTRSERVIAWAFVLFGVALALPWLDPRDTQGLAFRLRVSAFVPLAIGAAIVTGAAVRWVLPVPRSEAAVDTRQGLRDLALAAVALALVLRAPQMRDRREGRIEPHPALVSAVIAATTKIPPGTTVIVPERHIMFMVAWYTRAPSVLRPERVPYGRRVRLLPLHFTGMGSPLEAAIDAARADSRVAEPPIGVHPRHRNGLVLVSEPTWDWLVAALPADVRRIWARWRTI